MIKKIYILLLTVLGMGVISSCSDYLNSEKYFKDRLTLEKTFESKDHVEEWLAYAFSFIKNENYEVTTKGPSENSFCFSDDMYYGDRDKTIDATKNELSYNMFKLGEYDENTYNVGAWGACYKGIFQASVFIHNVDRCQEMADWEILDYKGQARFVRAYYYWLLLRRYGPVPIMPDEGVDYTQSYDQIATPRSSYEEVAQYISDEMVQATKELQYDRRTDNYAIGRPTRGAALAVRAYALIFAASPFANGNNDEYAQQLVDDEGRRLLSSEYSEEKWAKAAAAARDVIEGNWYKLYTAKFREEQVEGDYANPKTIVPPYHPVYSKANFPDGWKDIDPLESYRSVFNGEVNFFNNPEMIFSRVINNGAELHPDLGDFSDVLDMVRHQMPASLGGWNIHSMTMKQCDAYDMADGTAFDRKKCLKGFAGPENKKDRPYDNLEDGVWMGYANREPRFYASVGYNGARWNCTSATGDGSEVVKNQQVWYYRGSKDGRSNNSERWLATGIGIKKYIHPSDCYVNNGTALPKVEPALRYADILISYAEALNNIEEGNNYQIESWDGSTTYTVRRDINEMRRGMKPVRMRAGVPDFPDGIYNNRKLFFTRVVHERQVEFFNESQRYYDVRRWKIAPEHEGAQIYGCNVMMDEANREMFYTPVRVSGVQTAFSRKQYFWPVNYDELQRNKNMTQAPGWQDYD